MRQAKNNSASKRSLLKYIAPAVLAAISVLAGVSTLVSAVGIPDRDFSLEVSPSPLAMTVKPGQASTVELRVRNASRMKEDLVIQARDFTVDQNTGDVKLGETTPADLKEWVSFSNPRFTAGAGQWFTQRVTVRLPDAAGFSYPFAIVISRASEPSAAESGGSLLKGSIAVFTLVNVDKPGATRKLKIEDVSSNQGIYEFLPATINVRLRNTGNSIVQPYGNIFIQRTSNDNDPLKTLSVNENKSYILPGSARDIPVVWADGFPVYQTSAPDADGKTKQSLAWNWNTAGNFRFGRYTAKVVAVYNDGSRDVPIIGEVSFWVIPWRILLGILVILIILLAGMWAILRPMFRRLNRGTKKPRP